jgi:hypothetical protein
MSGRGWLRLWSGGPGIAWKPAADPPLFSERNGYIRWYLIGPWRVRLLPQGGTMKWETERWVWLLGFVGFLALAFTTMYLAHRGLLP